MKIRRAFVKSINWILAGIITMLGFAGCKDILANVEYGTPYADYTVKGTVVNKETKSPIKGIRVGYTPTQNWPTYLYGVPPTPYQLKAHVITDADGWFKLTDRFYIGEFQMVNNSPVLPVFVEDIDDAVNGWFQSEYLWVDFSDAVRSGKVKGWYGGEYTVTISIELTEKE